MVHNSLFMRSADSPFGIPGYLLEPRKPGPKAHFFLLRPRPKTKAKLAKEGLFAKEKIKNQGQIGKNYTQNHL